MAMYTPLPFVGKPLDQSEQQMRLVDLMYQAQLARIQREQEARLQGANMFMNLGMQLPQILSNVEENRIREMTALARQREAETERQFRDAQIRQWEQDRIDRAEAARQARLDREKEDAAAAAREGRAIAASVYGMTPPGAIEQDTMDMLMQSEAYRPLLKYEFGPGTAEGPRLMEDPARMAARLKEEQAQAAKAAAAAQEATQLQTLAQLASEASDPRTPYAQRLEAANRASLLGGKLTPLPEPEPVKPTAATAQPFGATPGQQKLIAAVEQDISLLDKLAPQDRADVIAAIGPARLDMVKAKANYPRLNKELETVTALLGDDRGRNALLTSMPGGQSEAILATFGRQTGASDYKALYDNLKAGQVFNADFLSSLKGQISDKDVAIIQSAASKLSLNQSPQAQKAELQKMYDALTRAIAETERKIGGSMNTRAGLGDYPG